MGSIFVQLEGWEGDRKKSRCRATPQHGLDDTRTVVQVTHVQQDGPAFGRLPQAGLHKKWFYPPIRLLGSECGVRVAAYGYGYGTRGSASTGR